MSNNKKEVLKQISKIKNSQDINHNVFDIFDKIIELNDKNFLAQVYEKFKIKAKKNYFANMILLQCLAKYFDKKEYAYDEFNTKKFEDPEEYDDVYIEAYNLLKLCGRRKEELENLRRDVDLMFDNDGKYIKDWTEKL